MKKIIKIALTVFLCYSLMGCAKVYYHFNDVVSFRLENDSEQDIYVASLSFGTKNITYGSMTGENADGTALANQGKDCLVFPVEQGDMNDTKLEDIVFEFFICTKKGSDFIYVGTVTVTSSKLHKTYTLTLKENNNKLVLTSADSSLDITMDTK